MNKRSGWIVFLAGVVCLAALITACAKKPEEATQGAAVRTMPASQQFAGFLKDYSKLQQNPQYESTMSFVNKDPAKNIHQYVAVIVDPPVLYLASDKNPKDLPDRGRTALAEYFQSSMTRAIQDAFPVVTHPGPLVLRLRTALVGVDVGAAGGQSQGEELERAVNIGKVGVEAEFVDSLTGEQIAAAVDRESLGDAAIGSAGFTHEEKYRAAVEAVDGWAARLRAFLDSAHELSAEDAAKADKTYRPYGE